MPSQFSRIFLLLILTILPSLLPSALALPQPPNPEQQQPIIQNRAFVEPSKPSIQFSGLLRGPVEILNDQVRQQVIQLCADKALRCVEQFEEDCREKELSCREAAFV